MPSIDPAIPMDFLYCQAQPKLQVQLEAELALFSFDPATPTCESLFSNICQCMLTKLPYMSIVGSKLEDDLNFLANGRRPQVVWEMEDNLNFLAK